MNRRFSAESLKAYGSQDRERLRSLVLDYVRSSGSRGVIADECSAALGLLHNSVAPRLVELKAGGAIVELYDRKGNRVRRETRQGCQAGVVIAAEFAPATSALPEQRSLFPECHKPSGVYRDPEESRWR